MRLSNKSTVRQRTPSDDEGLAPDEVWPAGLRWVHDHDIHYQDGTFYSGGTYPYETWADAMGDAEGFARFVQEHNAQEDSEPTAKEQGND